MPRLSKQRESCATILMQCKAFNRVYVYEAVFNDDKFSGQCALASKTGVPGLELTPAATIALFCSQRILIGLLAGDDTMW